MESFPIQKLNTTSHFAKKGYNVQKLRRENFGARKTETEICLKTAHLIVAVAVWTVKFRIDYYIWEF
jgi:hypothetical protein